MKMKMILLTAIVFLTGCFISSWGPPWAWRSMHADPGEHLVFPDNAVHAQVVWQAKATAALYYSVTGQMFVSGDPVLSKSGVLYFQNSENTIKAVHSRTGDTITVYTVPDPFVMSNYYNNNNELIIAAINRKENTFTTATRDYIYFIVINEKKKRLVHFIPGNENAADSFFEYQYAYYTNKKIVDFVVDSEPGEDDYVEVRNANSKQLWSNRRSSLWHRLGKTISIYTHSDIVYGVIDLYRSKSFQVIAYRLKDGKPIWTTTFDKTDDMENYVLQPYKNKFLFVVWKNITKGKDDQPHVTGKIIALRLSDGSMVWTREGYVANYPHIRNTIYLVDPHSNNTLQVVSPETGDVITSSAIEDAFTLEVVFEAPEGVLYFSKDTQHLECRNERDLQKVWSIKISNAGSPILPDIQGSLLSSDEPYSAAYEYGKSAYTENRYVFTDTTYVADVKTGKLLWKARVVGANPVVVRTVLSDNDMAFIKTAAGNIFAVKWNGKKE